MVKHWAGSRKPSSSAAVSLLQPETRIPRLGLDAGLASSPDTASDWRQSCLAGSSHLLFRAGRVSTTGTCDASSWRSEQGLRAEHPFHTGNALDSLTSTRSCLRPRHVCRGANPSKTSATCTCARRRQCSRHPPGVTDAQRMPRALPSSTCRSWPFSTGGATRLLDSHKLLLPRSAGGGRPRSRAWCAWSRRGGWGPSPPTPLCGPAGHWRPHRPGPGPAPGPAGRGCGGISGGLGAAPRWEGRGPGNGGPAEERKPGRRAAQLLLHSPLHLWYFTGFLSRGAPPQGSSARQ